MIKSNSSKTRFWIITGVALLVIAVVTFFLLHQSGKAINSAEGTAKAVLAVETVYPQLQDWSVSITMNQPVASARRQGRRRPDQELFSDADRRVRPG